MPTTRREFGRALGFAALAALLTVPALMLGMFTWGYAASLASYMLWLAPISLFINARDLRSGVRVLLVSGAVTLIAAWFVPYVETALVLTCVQVAMGRGFLHRPPSIARALVTEVILGGLACGAFAALHDEHLFGEALAVWAFWLVQSGAVLLAQPGVRPVDAEVDAFDAAQAAAERIMQGIG